MSLTAQVPEKKETEVTVWDFQTAILEDIKQQVTKMEKKWAIEEITDKDQYAFCMKGLADFREKRLSVTEGHKIAKSDIIKEGKKLDKRKNEFLELLMPGENHLKNVRQAYDRIEEQAEKNRIETIQRKIDMVKGLGSNLSNLSSVELSERYVQLNDTSVDKEEYQEFLSDLMMVIHNGKIELSLALDNRKQLDKEDAERKAENERLEKIRVEQEENQKKIDEENRKIDERAKELAKKDRELKKKEKKTADKKEREKFEAEAKERAEKKAAEKIAQAQKAAEEQVKFEEAERVRKAKMAPDRDKILDFAKTLEALALPDVKSEEAGILLIDTGTILKDLVGSLRERAEEL